ncbi:MAG: SDR family oxidoreductase [Chloroflexota bacterium]
MSDKQKVILITGAAKGIGRASAEQLMSEGHIVYGGDIAFEEMADLEAKGMHRLKWDVTIEQDSIDAAKQAFDEQGRIDGVFANAGYTCMGMYELVSLEEARRQFEVNVFGMASTVKAVLPYMRNAAPEGSGHIIFTSSGAGKVSPPGMGWYPATKHATEALADSLRREMMHLFPGIKVVLVEPGFIPTELYNASEPTWHKAMEHPEAEVYRKAMENYLYNFKKGFYDGAPVETISNVVSKAFNSDNPRKRYHPNPDAMGSIWASKLIENTDLFDKTLINMMFSDPK